MLALSAAVARRVKTDCMPFERLPRFRPQKGVSLPAEKGMTALTPKVTDHPSAKLRRFCCKSRPAVSRPSPAMVSVELMSRLVSRIRCLVGVSGSLFSSSRHGYCVDWRRSGEDHRHLAQVLGDGSEQELVASAAWSPQSEPPHTQDTLEMGEQHLDLFTFPA
jgi:hypothetical protein